ncbi:MAG: hypothetical protein AAGF59_03770 [Pseudomonadota bacterium]
MPVPQPVFKKAPGTELYWRDDSEQLAGFLASPGADLGDDITLLESWADEEGLYFFVVVHPSDVSELISELRAWQQDAPTGSQTRLIWIWNLNEVVNFSNSLAVPLVKIFDQQSKKNGWFTQAARQIVFGEITVDLPQGLEIAPEEFGMAWRLGLTATQGATISVTGPQGTIQASGAAGISYADYRSGCLQAVLSLPHGGQQISGLERLGAGIRYFCPGENGQVKTLYLKALIQDRPLTTWMSLDPLRRYSRPRTSFSFHDTWGNPPIAVQPIASGFTTGRGLPLKLQPLPKLTVTTNGRLVFDRSAVGGENGTAYLTLEGEFALSHANAADDKKDEEEVSLLCGLSGLETIWMAKSGAKLIFKAGGRAYAPLGELQSHQSADGDVPETDPTTALTSKGSTAWIFPEADPAAAYHTQPQDAPFYGMDGQGALFFLSLEKATFPAYTSINPGIPIAPYGQLGIEQNALARQLESVAIAPARATTMEKIGVVAVAGSEQEPEDEAEASETIYAVTPSGLIGKINLGRASTWPWLAFANNGPENPSGKTSDPDVRFTEVRGKLKSALMTNQLFMVMGNPEELMGRPDQNGPGSIEYGLTPETIGMIAGLGLGPAMTEKLELVAKVFEDRKYEPYGTEVAFWNMLDTVGCNEDQIAVFLRYAGRMLVRMGDWTFQMSPRNWVNPERVGAEQSFVIMKFVSGRSIAALVEDASCWVWPEVSEPGGNPIVAQAEIRRIFAKARLSVIMAKEAGARSSYENFVDVIDDPNWSGVLALSIDAPLDALPDALKPLAAGIDRSQFYAHHVGLTMTPFSADDGVLEFTQTPSFGLVEYDNPENQYFSTNIPYAFRVMQLRASFNNAKLIDYSSRVQLLVNRLFGSVTRLLPTDHGNNVILDGTYQKQTRPDGSVDGTYVFAMQGSRRFQLLSGALKAVTLTSAQMVTAQPPDIALEQEQATATFLLQGELEFEEPDYFDPFSYGPPINGDSDGQSGDGNEADDDPRRSALRFSNLAINMTFPMSGSAEPEFSVAEGNIFVDAANSHPRPNSLIALFPLRLTGFTTTANAGGNKGTTPEDLGFVSIGAPIQQGILSAPWYGLIYHIDLGSLGALASGAGISARLLVGWSPANENSIEAQFIGIALPGLKNTLGVDMPLQGILNLGFRSIEFSASDDEAGVRSYILRLRDFGLRALGLSFPPGHNDISLFANPNQTAKSKLGWYAAYSAPVDTPSTPTSQGSGLPQSASAKPALRPGNVFPKSKQRIP